MGKFYKFGRFEACEFITCCTECDAELWVDEDKYDLAADLGAKLVNDFGETAWDDPCAVWEWTCDSRTCQREKRAARKARKVAAKADEAAAAGT